MIEKFKQPDSNSLSFYREQGFVCHSILDDYSKKPILSNGGPLNINQSFKLTFKSIFSRQFYMNKISDHEQLISFVRGLKAKIK